MNREYYITLPNGGCMTMSVSDDWTVMQDGRWWIAHDGREEVIRIRCESYRTGDREFPPRRNPCLN